MKITAFETIPLKIPFSVGGPAGSRSAGWNTLEMVVLRLETDNGLVGWGDAFSYHCSTSVQAALDTMVKPLVMGREVSAIAPLMYELQQKLHLWGRYGITLFALSGLDIALWDLAGKAAQQPLCKLWGGAPKALPGYASLFFLGDPEVVAEHCRMALAQGYSHIKLHETGVREVHAAREVIGSAVPLMIDTNCPWTPGQAREMALKFKPYDPYWLEEPIFPPEDYAALAALQREVGIPLAAGENACTAFQFRDMFAAGAVKFAQPSVTKVGGITEFRKIVTLAETSAVTVMPHAPYFGPGFLATLQLMGAMTHPGLVERFYLELEASLYGSLIDPVDGQFSIPDGPGLGCEPDPDVLRDYRVS